MRSDPTSRQPGLRPVFGRISLEPAVQLDAVHHHARHGEAGSELPHQPGGVERAAARELGPLDEEHVTLAPLGEVVGDARPADPTADDHHPGAVTHPAAPRARRHPPADDRAQAGRRSPSRRSKCLSA